MKIFFSVVVVFGWCWVCKWPKPNIEKDGSSVKKTAPLRIYIHNSFFKFIWIGLFGRTGFFSNVDSRNVHVVIPVYVWSRHGPFFLFDWQSNLSTSFLEYRLYVFHTHANCLVGCIKQFHKAPPQQQLHRSLLLLFVSTPCFAFCLFYRLKLLWRQCCKRPVGNDIIAEFLLVCSLRRTERITRVLLLSHHFWQIYLICCLEPEEQRRRATGENHWRNS